MGGRRATVPSDPTHRAPGAGWEAVRTGPPREWTGQFLSNFWTGGWHSDPRDRGPRCFHWTFKDTTCDCTWFSSQEPPGNRRTANRPFAFLKTDILFFFQVSFLFVRLICKTSNIFQILQLVYVVVSCVEQLIPFVPSGLPPEFISHSL